MKILSKSRETQLRDTLHYLDRFTRENAGKITEIERTAINNLKFTICNLLCVDNKVSGCYLNDLRECPRTEFKLEK